MAKKDDELQKALKDMSPQNLMVLRWRLMRNPKQQCPKMPDGKRPFGWFLLGGRGSGKTLTSANHVLQIAIETAIQMNDKGAPKSKAVRVAMVGANFDDAVKTMVEGETGLLGIVPEDMIVKWNRTVGELHVYLPEQEREVHFMSYTSNKPAKLRGPQFHIVWCDEPAKFDDSDIDPMGRDSTWSNMMFGLRLGSEPHVVVSGTPTPCKLVKFIRDHEAFITSHMTTYDNIANLPQHTQDELRRLSPNSRIYRQEVLGEILDDNPDAVFSDELIHDNRADPPEDKIEAGQFYKVLGYDPSATTSADTDECGIILAGYTPEVKERARFSENGGGRPRILEHIQAYVLRDLSGHLSPNDQTALVVKTILEEGVTDLIFEQNIGVEHIISSLSQQLKQQTSDFKIRKEKKPRPTDYGTIKRYIVSCKLLQGGTHKFTISAIHANKSKQIRAEGISINYDLDQVHHSLDPRDLPTCKEDYCKTSLEYQMTTWSPLTTKKSSPDRLDALVYALIAIFGGHCLYSKNNSFLLSPAPLYGNDTLNQDQVIPMDRATKQYVSIYTQDLGEDSRLTRMEEIESAWGRSLT